MAHYSDENIIGLYHKIAQINNRPLLKHQYYTAISSPAPYWPNIIFDLNIPKDDIDQAISTILKDVKTNRCPPTTRINADTTSRKIIDFFNSLPVKTGMLWGMSKGISSPPTINPLPGFKVSTVDTQDELKLWIQVLETTLLNKSKLSLHTFSKLMQLPEVKLLKGVLNDELICTAMVFKTKQTAGLYLISTLLQYQNNGYGKCISKHCLQYAIDLNCTVVTLQATQLGRFAYEAIGFDVDTQMPIFNLKN